ncbi:MAG: hypothetical protein AAFV53_28680 [Myxococcota bacterium]
MIWISTEDGVRYQMMNDERALSWREFVDGLQQDLGLALNNAIRDTGLSGVFWECAPWPPGEDPVFEFVLLETSAFARQRPSSRAFREHLSGAAALTVRFANLRGDAELVVPIDLGDATAYGHLAAFAQRAPAEQVEHFWQQVGDAAADWRRQQRGTLWLSTHGLGVPWLHVRLDSRPKYYQHRAYRRR